MSIQNVERLSLGQWNVAVKAWNKANGAKPKAPSDDEFEAAVALAG